MQKKLKFFVKTTTLLLFSVLFALTPVTARTAGAQNYLTTNKSISLKQLKQQQEESKNCYWHGNIDFADVRGFIWGVSKKDVMKFEKGIYFDEYENSLFFIDNMCGVKILIEYDFLEDKLYKAIVEVNDRDAYSQKSFDDYLKIKINMDEIHGQASREILNWKKDQYKKKPYMWPQAIYMGQLEIYTYWQTENSNIKLSIKGHDFYGQIKIVYSRKNDDEIESMQLAP